METLIAKTFDEFYSSYQALTKQIYGKTKTLIEPYENKQKKYFVQIDSNNNVLACAIYFSETTMSIDEKAVVCFGYFEAMDNVSAVLNLIESIKSQMLQDQVLIGPMNGSTWDSYRVAISLFEPSFPMDVSNPAYYPQLLEKAGLEIAKSYASHIDKNFIYDKNKIEEKRNQLEAQGATIRNIDLSNFEHELDKVYELCMESFTSSFLFSQIPREEFKSRYLAMKPYLQEEYIWFVVNEQDDLKGMMFALSFPLPDGTKGYMAKTLARVPDNKYAGIGSVLSGLLIEKALDDGCLFGVHAFMEANNVSNILSGRFSGEAAKMYHLYKYQN